MSSAHEKTAEAGLDLYLSDPEGRTALGEMRTRILAGQRIPPVYGQKDDRLGEWSAVQTASFLAMHTNMMLGHYAQVDIELECGPYSDRMRDLNAERLANLPSPFVAYVDLEQNSSTDGDGRVEWSEPITLYRSTGVPLFSDHYGTAPRLDHLCHPSRKRTP